MERELKTWESFDSLKSQRARLLTFKRWPLSWLSPRDLAHAGFFYLKKSDFVQCAFCRGVVGDWEKHDIPAREHAKFFPCCPLVNNLPVGNIRDLQVRPKFQDYISPKVRLATFKDWPQDMTQKPHQLAEAGFIYQGLSDHVKCFFCGGGLRNWDPRDKPWRLHRMYFPHCDFATFGYLVCQEPFDSIIGNKLSLF